MMLAIEHFLFRNVESFLLFLCFFPSNTLRNTNSIACIYHSIPHPFNRLTTFRDIPTIYTSKQRRKDADDYINDSMGGISRCIAVGAGEQQHASECISCGTEKSCSGHTPAWRASYGRRWTASCKECFRKAAATEEATLSRQDSFNRQYSASFDS